MNPLITPVINLNGNTAKDLIDRLKRVVSALAKVEEVMAEANDICHGRNFQHLITERFDRTRHVLTVTEANHAWAERRVAVSKIRNEVIELAMAIQAQEKK